MPNSQISFPSCAVNIVLEAAQVLGVDRSYLLNVLGEEAGKLPLKYGRISGQSYDRLVRRLLELVPDGPVGLAIAEINFPRALSPYEAGLYTSPTLRAALEVYAESAKVLADDVSFSYTINPNTISLWGNQQSRDPFVRHFRNQLYSGRLALILSDLLGDQLVIKKIQFDTPRLESDCSQYLDIFGIEPEFGHAKSCIIIDKIDIDKPIPQIYPEVHLFIKEDLEKRIRALNFSRHFTEKVRLVLEAQEPYTTVSIEIIADKLHLVPSTLRKKLRNENTSFSKLIILGEPNMLVSFY